MSSPAAIYHQRQYIKPYRSTVAIHSWLKSLGCFQNKERIADICCGMGAPTAYFAEQEPQCSFLGIERNIELVTKAELPGNASIEVGDMYDLGRYRGEFGGVLNLQTLSWLPECRKPLEALCALEPDWIGLSSLFYDGPLNTIIQVTETDTEQTHNYNVYSIPLVREILAKRGYANFACIQFEIDIDLPKTTRLMGTYTETLQSGERIQISGPLLMPWYFIFAARKLPLSDKLGSLGESSTRLQQ